MMQDAPAAILTVMVLGIASAMPSGASSEALFATVVATSALTTVTVAGLFIAVGSFGLGRLVRYVPYPVIVGFLAGTGWLLFTGGVTVMVDMPLTAASLASRLPAVRR